jgi:DNA adenine methylase
MDPPYFPSARGDWKGKVSEGAYRHEMSTSDHSHFLHTVKQIKGMVIISGYRCPMYNGQLSDWDSVDMKTKGTANASLRTETLWFNPKLQAARLPLLNMEVNL